MKYVPTPSSSRKHFRITLFPQALRISYQALLSVGYFIGVHDALG
jgi:hypothetical protein